MVLVAMDSDNALLHEARQLYDQATQAAALKEHDGGKSKLVTLNRAVRSDVATAVREPLEQVVGCAREGLEAVNTVKEDVISLPKIALTELGEIPKRANLDPLTSDVPRSIRSVAETLGVVAKKPSLLFPRLLCGSVAVDPAKIGRTLLRVNHVALGVAGGAMSTGVDVAMAMASSFGCVSEPLVEGLDALRFVRKRLGKCFHAVSKLTGGAEAGAISNLSGTHEKVSSLVDRFTSLFSREGDEIYDETMDENGVVIARGAPAKKHCLDAVGEGTEMLRSAGGLRDALESCINAARAFGRRVSLLARMLKKLFSLIVRALKKLVKLLKRFFKKLPIIIEQIKKFFIPSGLMRMFFATSQHTKNLLHAIVSLQTSVPTVQSVESSRTLFSSDSKSMHLAETLVGKLEEILKVPIVLVQRLVSITMSLPAKIIQVTKETLSRWMEKLGLDTIGERFEDTLVDIAEKIGGEKFADAVGDFLPFRNDEEERKSEATGSVLDDSNEGDKTRDGNSSVSDSDGDEGKKIDTGQAGAENKKIESALLNGVEDLISSWF